MSGVDVSMYWMILDAPRLLPSGGDFATCAAPMLPEAPGLFSMMMVVPSRVCSPGCTIRAIGSTVPPGGNGTTIRVMLPAPVWPRADCANGAVMAPSTSERRDIVVMAFPL